MGAKRKATQVWVSIIECFLWHWKFVVVAKFWWKAKRHHLHESPKGGTSKLSHFGCMASVTCNLEFHMVFLYRSLINTFQFPSPTKSPNNLHMESFCSPAITCNLSILHLGLGNPTAKWKRTQNYTILLCTRYSYIFLQLNFPLQTPAWAKGELLEKT
jgi:hypothetical protein